MIIRVNSKNFLLGIAIGLLIPVYGFLETAYFGYNLKPCSSLEMCADLLAIPMTWLAGILMMCSITFERDK